MGSSPTVALCPPLLTTTGGPGSNSCIQRLSLWCCYPWRGDNAPSERLRDAGLSWEEADFSCAAAGQTGFCPNRPPRSASAPLTKQNRVLCWKTWRGGKTSLQYSSPSLNIVIQNGVFGVPREMKPCFFSTGQVLETDLFQKGHLLQLKTCCFSGASLFDMTMAFLVESKLLSEETHLIQGVSDQMPPLCTYEPITSLCFLCRLQYHVQPHVQSHEKSQWRLLQTLGAAPLTSLGVLPLISVESWFHAGLCCHWTHGLITWLFTNWLWVSVLLISLQSCSRG